MKFNIGDRVIVENSNYSWLDGKIGKIIANDGMCLYGVEFDIEDEKLLHSCGGRGKANKCFWVADGYGKAWRAWTSRPTDEQRKAVAWDE